MKKLFIDHNLCIFHPKVIGTANLFPIHTLPFKSLGSFFNELILLLSMDIY